MKKKNFLASIAIVLSALIGLSFTPASQFMNPLTVHAASQTLDIENGNIVFAADKVTQSGNVYPSTDTYTITGNSTNQYDVVVNSGTYNITIQNLGITKSGGAANSPFSIFGGHVTLTLSGNCTLKSTGNDYAGLYVAQNTSLTINGPNTATLSAKGGNINDPEGASGSSAGIGMSQYYTYGPSEVSCGAITINGGHIIATGGSYASSIGGSVDSSCSSITINGGKIEADGIGNGWNYYSNSSGTVTVNGGTIVGRIHAGAKSTITGGNIQTGYISPAPVNSSGNLIYLVMLSGLVNNATVTALSVKVGGNSYSYDKKDIYVNGNGQVYLWLPVNASNAYTDITVTAEGSPKNFKMQVKSSGAVADLTNITVPDPPSDVAAVNITRTKADITFTAPDNGGSPITGYTVTAKAGSQTITANGTASPIPLSGLTLGTTYNITVTAKNIIGESAGAVSSFTTTDLSSENKISSFIIGSEHGVIDNTNHTVSVTVPYGTELTSLAPVIQVSAGATVSPLSENAQDFTNPVTYTVTAENNSTQDYIVTVKAALFSENEITSFSIGSAHGVIDNTNHTVSVTVPYGTDLTELTPVIHVSTGATLSPLSGTAQDFTNPMTYTVTAENNSKQDYTVTVIADLSLENKITTFNIGSAHGAIDNSNHTVSVTVPTGTDLTTLTPVIHVSAGATVSPLSGASQDFTSPITYTVTAENNSTQDYTVIVKAADVLTPDNDDNDAEEDDKDKYTSQPRAGDAKGWSEIEELIDNSEKGDEIYIVMNHETDLPKEVLSAIMGKNIDLIIDMGDYTWAIRGKDVTSARKDIDLRVKLDIENLIDSTYIKNLAGDRSTFQIKLEYDGNLGFTGTLTINVGSEYAGKYANLYYYNPETNGLEYQTSGFIETDGDVDLDFSHASKYVIVFDSSKTITELSAGAEIKDNVKLISENGMPYAVAVAILTVGMITYKKVRKAK